MKIFVFGYDRHATMTTSLYLSGKRHTVLIHDDSKYESFMSGGRIGDNGDVMVTFKPKGLAYNRNYALDLMAVGEWAMFLVDDITRVTHLNPIAINIRATVLEEKEVLARQPYYRDQFNTPLSIEGWLKQAYEDIPFASELGYNLVGYSLTGNPLFRLRKYSYGGLADGRAWLVRKTHLRFDENVHTMDDYAWCALNKKHFGGYLVNNWLHPEAERYTAGGVGTKEERMDQKIREAKYLVQTYPEFIAPAEKTGWPPGSHVKMRTGAHNPAQNSLF